jgi:hypothetical protein
MRDLDVALVRHFLIEGAKRTGEPSLVDAIADWEYQGPGVWIGVAETALADHPAVFEAATEVVQQLGDIVPLDYLTENVRLSGAQWLEPQKTSEVVACIRGLQEHLRRRT